MIGSEASQTVKAKPPTSISFVRSNLGALRILTFRMNTLCRG